MSKYAPLQAYLQGLPLDEVAMTFAEIERVIGFKLPERSQHHRAWWSNNAANNVLTKVWLAAGYRTERVDMAGRRLVFKRAGGRGNPAQEHPHGPAPSGSGESSAPGVERKRHPLFGALAHITTIAPGVDLTEPADPIWGEPT